MVSFHPKATALAAALILLTVPATLATPGKENNNGQTGGPAGDAVDITLNLEGVATQTDGGPTSTFFAYVNVTGEGLRKTSNGNGVQIFANDLAGVVTIYNTDEEGNPDEVVAQFDALVDFHAQQASSIAQGLDPGNFRFNLGLRGDRGETVLGSETESRIMAFNSHGSTTGPADDNGAHAVLGKGQTTLKDAGSQSATHYNLALGGTGSILDQDSGGEAQAASASFATESPEEFVAAVEEVFLAPTAPATAVLAVFGF